MYEEVVKMKAKMVSICVVGLFLLASFSAISAVGKEFEATEDKTLIDGDGNNESDMCYRKSGGETTELSICYRKIQRGFTPKIYNKGSVNVEGLVFNISVKGGFLGLLDKGAEGFHFGEIPPGEYFSVRIPIFWFGFVNISISAFASNAEMVTENVRGFVILGWIIILPC